MIGTVIRVWILDVMDWGVWFSSSGVGTLRFNFPENEQHPTS